MRAAMPCAPLTRRIQIYVNMCPCVCMFATGHRRSSLYLLHGETITYFTSILEQCICAGGKARSRVKARAHEVLSV